MRKRHELYTNFLAQGDVKILTPREEKIVRMVVDGKSFEEIGIQFAVTRERIKQVADKASKKIERVASDKETKRLRDQRLEEIKTKDPQGLTIEELDLSVIAYNCLRNAGIAYADQLTEMTEEELLRIKNFGRRSLNEIKEIVGLLGIKLRGGNSPTGELSATQQNDLDTVVAGIKKLPGEEAREVSLCLLSLMLPFAVNNQKATDLLRHMRDGLLGE